jgi:hypothetical protein
VAVVGRDIEYDVRVMTATLTDSDTSKDFVSLLPLTLTLKDYAAAGKISDLPKRLSTRGAPAGIDPSIGDIFDFDAPGALQATTDVDHRTCFLP